ncbi:protein SYS1 homolog [Sycon ciliatum]|uniref:protein SYS1 homolog n=1 Tax=Sycon ciliatum TaxID=27933 RepID=UPI0020AC56C9|eukprot:scpid104464/ scgid22040/ Protein SYS1 homolog
MASFRSSVWDPLLIISQIVFMQSQFYVLFCLYLLIFTGMAHIQPTLTHVLSSKMLVTWHQGWPIILSYSLSALSGAISLRYAVRRSKNCMDFTVTMFFMHALLSCVTRGFPFAWQWWVVTSVSATVMVVLGEWLCMRMEMADIPVVGGSLVSGAPSSKRPGL